MEDKKFGLSLWLPYTALSGWLMCFMRVCFRSTAHTGLMGWENTLFIVLCAGIVLGMLVPLPDIRTEWQKHRALFRISAIAAIPCTILAVNTQNTASLILTFLASFFASVALGCSLYRISLQLEQKRFGMFFGTAFAASEGLLLVLLFFPFDRFVANIAVAILCFLLLLAVVTYRKGEAAEPQGDESKKTAAWPAKTLLRKYLLLILLYCIIGGMLDKLTAFDDAFFDIPNLLVFIYLFSVPAQLVLGAVFRRFDWHRVAMLGVLFICVGQSLSFFSSIAALAVPYLALTTMGIIIMEFIVRGLPTRFASGAPRPAMVSRLGYASLYGGFLITSVLFEFITRGRYYFVLGIVLLLAFAVLALMFIAASEEEHCRHERLMEELRQLHIESSNGGSLTSVDIEARMKQLGLTAREQEVSLLLLQGNTLRQIAGELGIAYSTVNFHTRALYRKLNINSRTELMVLFRDNISLPSHD